MLRRDFLKILSAGAVALGEKLFNPFPADADLGLEYQPEIDPGYGWLDAERTRGIAHMRLYLSDSQPLRIPEWSRVLRVDAIPIRNKKRMHVGEVGLARLPSQQPIICFAITSDNSLFWNAPLGQEIITGEHGIEIFQRGSSPSERGETGLITDFTVIFAPKDAPLFPRACAFDDEIDVDSLDAWENDSDLSDLY